MTLSAEAPQERAVVLATMPRDSELTVAVLGRAGVPATICRSIGEFSAWVEDGPALALLAEEALTLAGIDSLAAVLRRQPPWSDLPFIILTGGGGSTAASLNRVRLLERLGNITLLERPVRTVTLITAVRSALRARKRQYEVRDYLAERERAGEQLTKTAEQLARSNADLQQFAYITSHDLREPLRTIASFGQLLETRYGDKLDSDAREFISYITAGAARMDKMIHDLLAYSRVAHQEGITERNVELATVIGWATQNLNRAIEESQAEIITEELPAVRGDEVELVQLFQNLISNAIKYRRPDARLRLRIGARREGPQWLVSVADNGLGFEARYSERIFELFKRLHGKNVPGTGIGLTICKKIVERHGGRIWAESQAGRGATFYFTLPGASGMEGA
jgi:signal transduction histidine kinase